MGVEIGVERRRAHRAERASLEKFAVAAFRMTARCVSPSLRSNDLTSKRVEAGNIRGACRVFHMQVFIKGEFYVYIFIKVCAEAVQCSAVVAMTEFCEGQFSWLASLIQLPT